MEYKGRPKSDNVDWKATPTKINGTRRYVYLDKDGYSHTGFPDDDKLSEYKNFTQEPAYSYPGTSKVNDAARSTGNPKLQNTVKGADDKAPFNKLPRPRPIYIEKKKTEEPPIPLPRWKLRGPIKLK